MVSSTTCCTAKEEGVFMCAYAFDDEFAGPAGSAPDPTKWTYDTGAGGWGNNELETYTTGRANSYLDGAGHLVIKAIKSGKGYTSARLKTQGLFSRSHGNWEASIKFDLTPGSWPCWWMLGNGIDSNPGWPSCGEIDIVELYGSSSVGPPDTTVWSGDNSNNPLSVDTTIPGGVDTNWHTWHLRWDGNTGIMIFSKDAVPYVTVNPNQLANWPYGSAGHMPGTECFMLLNIAVGGDGGGKVPSNFTSAEMLVDYVRVW